ncbi:hypothetical protein [Hymenobacter cellulosivorans]|uniref:T9SS type A sorting domain-containing protein n=1 Tax=Hymenobacter cellulosivorans TaxID=2932249 RepID=A0ABY4F3T5_9BACT|nr:hypothetical protein [Hymenobacter cellulosivorans]UOQ50717.1 hypothetical protein MUN80_13205 [Hymenobacter cellulosivorans]
MKLLTTLFGAALAAVLCAAATPARAQSSEAISLTQTAPTALRLRISHPTAQAGRVQVVRLSTGQTLFTETYRAPAYGHRFDFRQAPSGRYLVWLQSGNNVHRCLVRVRTRAQDSVIRVDKLTSRTMPASLLISNLSTAAPVAGL